MDETIELTLEQKETKEFIRFIVKLIVYMPFVMVLFIIISLIYEGIMGGFN